MISGIDIDGTARNVPDKYCSRIFDERNMKSYNQCAFFLSRVRSDAQLVFVSIECNRG